MKRTIHVRRFSAQGSSVKQVAVEEAERIIEEASRRRALVLDEDKGQKIGRLEPETRNIAVIDPIVGG